MTTIRHRLHKELFGPNEERLMGVVKVTKPGRKKKTNYLCAIVTSEKPASVFILQVKLADKDALKKKTSWSLADLKVLDGRENQTTVNELDFHFEKPYRWEVESKEEKHVFITCLWKLCFRYLPRTKPKFINIPADLLEEPLTAFQNGSTTDGSQSSAQPNSLADELAEDFQALSEREESDLERLMQQCQFAISDTEQFTEQLTRELSLLDGANVHSLMASEQQVEKLMNMLDKAISEVTVVEQRLDRYDDILKGVRENMEQMDEKNALIQIQNANNIKLLDELDNLVTQLDISHKHQVALLDGDLTNHGSVIECHAAATVLLESLNASIHPALNKMAAVTEQRKFLEKLRLKFLSRLSRHLNNLFIHLGNDPGTTLSFHAVELTLPRHSVCHQELSPYADLMRWVRLAEPDAYAQLSKVYTGALAKLYDREMKEFFDSARARITPVGGVMAYRKTKASGSNQDLTVKIPSKLRSSSVTNEQIVMGGAGETSNRCDERFKFDKILERILGELEPVCLAEQEFCSNFFGFGIGDFFNLQSPQSTHSVSFLGGSQSAPDPDHTPHKEKLLNRELQKMMSELFQGMESELGNFVNYSDKIDNFYSMYVLVRLSDHVMSARDTGSFVSMTFANALVQAKRNFDKFMLNNIDQIEQSKPPKKSQIGILPFVLNFEEFAQQAEIVFRESERRVDLDKWYTKMVKSIFESVQRVSQEQQKTPPEVVVMENFHHLYSLLSQLKISSVDTERKDAKNKYNDALQNYVTKYFGRPLERLNSFFDGVQTKVSQGVREEEVGYQLAFSKQELRKVIGHYHKKEVKKGLESLYRKVEKHLSEEENLLQVVWHSMQDEFIRQYNYLETLINKCYPGSMITLEFTIDDLLEFFSDIARSH